MSTIFDGTNGITFPDGTVQASAPVGMKNRIINGDFRVDQRNSGAAITAGAALFYAVDRFYSSNQTGGGTITAQQSTLNGAKSLLVTATAAVTDLSASKFVYGASQPIEAQNMFDLNGKPVVLSFKVQTNWAGKLAVAFRNGAGNRCYIVDANVTAGINIISVPIILEAATASANDNSTGLQVSIGFNNTGTYQTTTTGAWAASPALCSNLSTQWALTTGNYINVTEMQLEAGTVATPFERRQVGLELALCQRYFEIINTNVFFAVGTLRTNGTASYLLLNTAQSMRAVPTVSFSAGGTAVIYSGDNTVGITLAGFNGVANTNKFWVSATHAGVGTAGQAVMAYVNGGTLLISAEL